MIAVFGQIAPFFAVVLIGYLAAKPGLVSEKGLLDEPGLAGLNAFIFKIALPPLLFRAMSRSPDATAEGLDLLLGYGVATIALYVAMRALGRLVFGLKSGENALFGYISINGNVGFLGLPLIALTLGDEAVLPTATVLSFDVILMMTATAIQLEASRAGGDALRGFARAILSPIPLSVIGGAAWGWIASANGLVLPDFLARMMDLLGSAAAPAALFATGAVLAQKKGDQRVLEISALTAAKLLVHPVLVALSLAYFAPDLPALWFAAGVLSAACPASNNAVLLASNFGRYELRASAVVLFTTALSILTYAAAAAWLQSGG